MKNIPIFCYRMLPMVLAVFFTWMPSILSQTPIDCDGDVTGSINPATDIDLYTFNADPGDIVIIRMQRDGSSVTPKILLTGPGVNETNIGSFSEAARIGALQLSGGTYTIFASDDGSNSTGNYGLSVQIIKPECAVQLNCTSDISASLSHAAEIDAYTFQVTGQNEFLIARMMQDLSTVVSRLELYGEGSSDMLGNTVTPGTTSTAERLDAAGLEQGTYVLLAFDSDGDRKGNYGLSLQSVKADCADPIGCTSDISATLSHKAEIDAYTFEVNGQNEFVIARMMQDLSTIESRLELYRDGSPGKLGTTKITGTTSTAERLDAEGLEQGTYVLLAFDSDGDRKGNYGLSLQSVKADCADPIGCTSDISATLSHKAEIDAYTFEVNGQNEFVIARMMQDLSTIESRLELYRDGSPGKLGTTKITGTTSTAERLDAEGLEQGTYVLLAFDSDGDRKGNYGLSLQSVKADCADPIGCTSDISATLSHKAEIDAYTFEVNGQNEFVIARMMQDLSTIESRLELYREGSTARLGTPTNPGTTSTAERLDAEGLEQGTYVLLAFDSDGDRKGNYGLSLQSVKADCADPIGCASDISATLSHKAEIDAYTFEVNGQNKLFIAKMIQNLSTVISRLELYREGSTTKLGITTTPGSTTTAEMLNAVGLEQGTYVLLAFDEDGDRHGDYNLSLQLLCRDCTQPIPCQGSLNSTINLPTEMDTYYFSAPNCDSMQIIFNAGGFSFDESLSIYGPNGDLIDFDIETGNDLAEVIVPLNEYGYDHYFIVVEENEANSTGSYTLLLNCISPFLTVDKNSISKNALGGTESFELITECPDWVIALADTTWSSPEPITGSGGSTVTVTIDPNLTPNSRSTNASITGCCDSITINIFQAGATLSASLSSISVSNDGEIVDLDINSTCIDWVLTVPSDVDWITPDTVYGSADQTIPLAIAPNCSNLPRSTTLTLSGCEITVDIQVNQSASFLNTNASFISVDVPEDQTSFEVFSNCNNWTVSENADWFSVNPNVGSDEGTVTVFSEKNATPNSRTDTIFISGCCIEREIIITQNGATLNAHPDSIIASSDAGETTINISGSCCDWTISDNASWLTVSPNIGNSNKEVKVSFEENSGCDHRTAEITISGCEIERKVFVTQEGFNGLSISMGSQTVEAVEGTTNFTVNGDCSWEVEENSDWINSVEINDTVVIVNYEANTAAQQRTDTIYVSCCGETVIFVLSQKPGNAIYIIPNPSALVVNSEADETTVNIESNCDSWEVLTDANWFIVIDDDGIFDGEFTVIFQENLTCEERNDTITISGCDVDTVTVIPITQECNVDLSIEPVVDTVGPEMGTATFNVSSSTNCDWIVESNASWLEPVKTGTTISVEYEANPTTALRTDTITVSVCEEEADLIFSQEMVNAVWDQRDIPILSVFPNPASKAFHVNIPPDLHVSRLTMTGITGWLCRDIPNVSDSLLTVHRNELPGGVYLLRLMGTDGRIVAVGKVVFTE